MGLGLRHSQVAPYGRSQMSPGVNLPDKIAGAAEVSRTSTMDGVADKDRDLEFDPLVNGKPVELVPQHRSDMVVKHVRLTMLKLKGHYYYYYYAHLLLLIINQHK